MYIIGGSGACTGQKKRPENNSKKLQQNFALNYHIADIIFFFFLLLKRFFATLPHFSPRQEWYLSPWRPLLDSAHGQMCHIVSGPEWALRYIYTFLDFPWTSLHIRISLPYVQRQLVWKSQTFSTFVNFAGYFLCVHRCTEGLCQDLMAKQSPSAHVRMCRNDDARGGGAFENGTDVPLII